MWQLTSPAFTFMLGWSSAWYGAHLVPALRLLGCTFQLLRIVRTALASYVRSSQARWLLAQHKGWSPCAQCWVAIQFSRCRLTDPGRNCVRFTDLWCPPFILHPYYSLFCSENQVLFQLFCFSFCTLSSSYIHIIVAVSKKIKLFSEISCELLHKEQCCFLSILPFVWVLLYYTNAVMPGFTC